MVTLHTSVTTDHHEKETELCLYHEVSDRKQELQERLSTETSRDVEIQTVEQGSIVMKLLLSDKETKDYIELLVETEMFDNILQEMFITDEFKDKCRVYSVNLKTEVEVESEGTKYKLPISVTNFVCILFRRGNKSACFVIERKYITYHIEDQYVFVGEEIHIQPNIQAISQKW